MRRWFLSYNQQDLALMLSLEEALRRKDTEAKIFFAPKSLRAGGLWLPELAREIVEATAFLLLVGEKGVGPWQVMEYYEALDRRVKELGFAIVFVLLEGQPAPGLPFLRQLHWVIAAASINRARLFSDVGSAAITQCSCRKNGSPGAGWPSRRTKTMGKPGSFTRRSSAS